MFLSANTPLVAIDIGTSSIKLAQVAGSRNKYELTSFGVMPLPHEAIVDGVIREDELVVDALSKLIKAEKIQTRYGVASVSGEAVIIKKIKVPIMTEAELAESIAKEAEQYIPFDIDDVAIDFQILTQSGLQDFEEEDAEEGKMEVLLVAVQKEIIDSRTAILEEAGLKPVIIDLDSFAAVNALGLSGDLSSSGSLAVIDLGASFIHLNVIQNGQTGFTQDIPGGGAQCTERLMSEFSLEFAQAEALKAGDIPDSVDREEAVATIVESFNSIFEEVERSFEFFSSTSNTQVEKVYLTGGGALTPGVDQLLSQKLKIPVEILNPLDNIKVSSRKFDRELIAQMGPMASVAVGLAIRKFDYK